MRRMYTLIGEQSGPNECMHCNLFPLVCMLNLRRSVIRNGGSGLVSQIMDPILHLLSYLVNLTKKKVGYSLLLSYTDFSSILNF